MTNLITLNDEVTQLYKTGLSEMDEAVCFCKMSEIKFSKKRLNLYAQIESRYSIISLISKPYYCLAESC